MLFFGSGCMNISADSSCLLLFSSNTDTKPKLRKQDIMWCHGYHLDHIGMICRSKQSNEHRSCACHSRMAFGSLRDRATHGCYFFFVWMKLMISSRTRRGLSFLSLAVLDTCFVFTIQKFNFSWKSHNLSGILLTQDMSHSKEMKYPSSPKCLLLGKY